MSKHYFIGLFCCFSLLQESLSAQNFGVGGDIMYNFQTESFGAGARVSIFPNKRLSFTPQFSYYFPFNPTHEYYAGMALEYKFIRRSKIDVYLLGHGAYHSWLNYQDSPMQDAEKSNWNGEGGIGIVGTKCWRPFIEYRYNTRFKEAHLRLGIMYVIGCKPQKWGFGFDNGSGGKNKRCSNYNF